MADPFAPGTTFAGYEIEALAGRGGMGVVYQARQLRPSRRVALKVIAPHLAEDPDFKRRFERESETAAAIEHPNVIPVYEVGDVDGQLFITMRFVEGTDLRALFNTRGGLDPVEATGLIAQVAAALDAAHERGLVHRDVKPANVLIAGREGAWHAYLTDFGLTKDVAADSVVTSAGMVVGTLDYIAPEQLMGQPVDARSDVYALGCVLFESLTGQVPYPRDTVVALMYAHGNEPAPKPCAVKPSLPAEFDTVVGRAMAKDPDERYQSAGDLARAAQAAARSQRPQERERSVARGAAAPTVATPVNPTLQTPVSHTAERPQPQPQPVIPQPVIPQESIAQVSHPATAAARPKPRRRGLLIGAAAAAVVVAVVLVVLLAGGGGSGDGDDGGGGGGAADTAADDNQITTDPATGTMSKEDYDEAASEIAASIDATHAEQHFSQGLPEDQAGRDQVNAELSHVANQYSTAGDQYDQLAPPAGTEAVHSRARDLIRELSSIVSEGATVANANDHVSFDALADRYGQTRDEIGSIDEAYADLGYDRLSSFNPGG